MAAKLEHHLKIDDQGNKIWAKEINRNNMNSFVDGVFTDDGGFILVGNPLEALPPFILAPSIVWVGKFDRKGEIKSEIILPGGRNGSITRGRNGRYVIVYDKMTIKNKSENAWTQDVWVHAFNSDLTQVWQSILSNIDRGMLGFKISSAPKGGFVIAGVNRAKVVATLWILRINEKGEIIWQFLEEPNPKSMMWNCKVNDLIAKNDKFYILSSIFSKNEKKQLNFKVGVIKFTEGVVVPEKSIASPEYSVPPKKFIESK